MNALNSYSNSPVLLSNSHPTTSLITFAVGIIFFSAAAYWFDSLSLTVSYSLLGLGTFFILGSLTHFAIQSCKTFPDLEKTRQIDSEPTTAMSKEIRYQSIPAPTHLKPAIIYPNFESEDHQMGQLHAFIRSLKDSSDSHHFNPYIFFKITGHLFGLSGTYPYEFETSSLLEPNEYIVDYESFPNRLACSIIMEDLLEYLPSSALKNETKEKISMMCKISYVPPNDALSSVTNPSPETLINQLNQGIPITLMMKPFNITMTHKELIYINKEDQFPGMHRFSIHVELTEERINQILAFNNPHDFPHGYNGSSSLEKLLLLEHIKDYPSSHPKTGCFANNRLCFKAAALLLGEDERIASNESRKAWSYSRKFWLEAIITIIERAPNDGDLKTELYFFLILLVNQIHQRHNNLGVTEAGFSMIDQIIEKSREWETSDSHSYLAILKWSRIRINSSNLSLRHQKILSDQDQAYPK